MKRFLKIAAMSLLGATLIAGTLAGCGEKAEKLEENKESNQAETENDNSQLEKDSDRIVCTYPIPSVYEMYHNSPESVFAILKLDQVEDAFYNRIPGSFDTLYLILECTVEEDYFHKLESGTKIHLPLCLTEYKKDPYSDLEPLKTMLGETERLLVYTAQAQPNRELEFRHTVTKESFTWEGIQPIYNTSLMELIPIRDDKVDFTSLFELFEEASLYYHVDYTKYIDDGMPLETLKENLKELSEKVDKEEPLQ